MPHLIDQVVANVNQVNADSQFQLNPNLDEARRVTDALRTGHIFFYGTRPVKAGHTAIDWSGAHVAHQEWPAQLNRFFWLDHAAALYAAEGDEDLARISRSIIDDWIDHHDYRHESPRDKGDNTLNLSIRLGQGIRPGWWGNIVHLGRSPHFDEAFVEKMRVSTEIQLDYLAGHVNTRGNWRISHLDCMLYVAMIVPGLERFADQAVRGLNDAFQRQINPDGSHEEHNPSYHMWMCRLFTRLWRIARKRPELGLKIDTLRAARMWDYGVCTAAPDGDYCGLHDGARWQKRGRRAANEPPQFSDERDAFLADAGLADDPAWSLDKRTVALFPDAGQLYVRDDWSPTSNFVIFDATKWGGGHCHLSRNSVSLYAGDRPLLVDPGTFTYEMSDPFSVYGKSTPAHCTLNVAGKSQTAADPAFFHVHDVGSAVVAASEYQGGYYAGEYTWGWNKGHGEGTFGTHHRAMVYLRGYGLVIYDLLITDGNNLPFASHWQLPPGEVSTSQSPLRAWTGGGPDGNHNVSVELLAANTPVTLSVHTGEKEPIRGWIPRQPGDYEKAPMLVFAGESAGNAVELITLAVPFAGDTLPDVKVHAYDRTPGAPIAHRITWPDGVSHTVVVSPGMKTAINEHETLATDADLAVLTHRDSKLTHAAIVGGMVLSVDGNTVIDTDKHGGHQVEMK